MSLKLDLHVHSNCSRDAFTDPETIAHIAKQRGLDGVAVTEHDAITACRSSEVLVVRGIEVSSRDGHIVALGVSEAVPKGLSAEQTIELLRRQNCIIIIPHPYDMSKPSVDPLRLGVGVDGIETINSTMIPFTLGKKRSEKAAEILGVSKVAGSDSHIPSTIGDAYTLLEASSLSIEGVLESIRSGRTTPCGSSTSVKNRLLKVQMDLARRFQMSSD